MERRFIELLNENKCLPVIAMINPVVIGEDREQTYVGCIGNATIEEYVRTPNKTVEIKGWSDMGITLENVGLDPTSMDEEEIEKYYENLPWGKCIILLIEPARGF